jgi:murein DD-endopeptidase MepM/ murein hydrolase activator NlpD
MSLEAHRRLHVLAALVLVLSVALAVPAIATTPEEARLEETQAKLAEIRSQLDAAEAAQSNTAAAFAQAEERLLIVMEALNAAEAAVDRQQQRVDAAAERLKQLESARVAQQRVMAQRAIHVYKQGSFAPVGSVLTSASPQEALRRTALVDVVTRADQRVVEQVTVTETAITAQRKQLATEQETLERVAEQQREIAAEAEELRDDKALAFAASSERVQALEGEETHLTAESRELAALARRAEQAALAASRSQATAAMAAAPAGPTSATGWVWPAAGPLTSGFGYRWGRMHEGIDIGAPYGAPIYAAAAGTVSYAGVMGGYGNIILVDHGGGVVTAYAHQSAFVAGVGTSVSAGDLIGRIGSTGQSTGPHLHFEVRVGGSPRDPLGYLP